MSGNVGASVLNTWAKMGLLLNLKRLSGVGPPARLGSGSSTQVNAGPASPSRVLFLYWLGMITSRHVAAGASALLNAGPTRSPNWNAAGSISFLMTCTKNIKKGYKHTQNKKKQKSRFINTRKTTGLSFFFNCWGYMQKI